MTVQVDRLSREESTRPGLEQRLSRGGCILLTLDLLEEFPSCILVTLDLLEEAETAPRVAATDLTMVWPGGGEMEGTVTVELVWESILKTNTVEPGVQTI